MGKRDYTVEGRVAIEDVAVIARFLLGNTPIVPTRSAIVHMAMHDCATRLIEEGRAEPFSNKNDALTFLNNMDFEHSNSKARMTKNLSKNIVEENKAMPTLVTSEDETEMNADELVRRILGG